MTERRLLQGAARKRPRELRLEQDVYRLCYVRGPVGILIGLTERTG
jgi:hypothetical protein